jgi:tetratricopeptide (TPR) repeat protein
MFPFIYFMLALILAPAILVQSVSQPSPEVQQAQTLVDAGKLPEADASLRQYLASHEDSAQAHYLLAYVLFRENQPKASLHEYSLGAQTHALSAAEWEVIGCDYFLLEDYASADKWLTKSLESGNKNALALYLLGRTKYNERHFQEAVDLLKQSLELDPKSEKAQTNLARAFRELGRTDDAIAAYRAAISIQGDPAKADPEPYAELGAILLNQSKPSEAVPLLLRAVQLAPDDTDNRRQLGKTYLALHQPEAARSALEQAVRLDPASAPAHFLLAQAYQQLGMGPQAANEQSKYRELSAGHSVSGDPLEEARSLTQSGHLPEAEQVVRRYLELHKNSAGGHYLLGYILFKKLDAKDSLAEYTEGAKYRRPTAADLETVAGDYVILHDYPDADKWFTKAVEWDPDNWQALYYLGRTKYNENLFDEAVKVFQQCLKADPKSVKAADNLGLALEALGRTDEAMTAYQNAISWQSASDKKDPGPYLNLGSLLVREDRSGDALPYLQQAMAMAPRDVRVHRELGKAYMHLNELDKAEAELETSVKAAPDDAPTHFVLAQVYRKRGMAGQARDEMQRYAALASTHSIGDPQ